MISRAEDLLVECRAAESGLAISSKLLSVAVYVRRRA